MASFGQTQEVICCIFKIWLLCLFFKNRKCRLFTSVKVVFFSKLKRSSSFLNGDVVIVFLTERPSFSSAHHQHRLERGEVVLICEVPVAPQRHGLAAALLGKKKNENGENKWWQSFGKEKRNEKEKILLKRERERNKDNGGLLKV